MASDDGKLDDRFAWLVSLDIGFKGYGGGRVCIPALRSQRDESVVSVVNNLAAVPAWADWHEPLEPLGLPTRPSPERLDELRRDDRIMAAERRGAAAAVRVLNIMRTGGGGDPAADSPPGRHVTPHMRRGHWRRQHYGPGRTLTQRVRIAPTLIGASRFIDVTPRVYRIPAPSEQAT